MPTLGAVGRQLKSLMWRASVDEEVSAELDFHVEMLTRELVAAGLPADAARAEALRRFGDLDAVRATCRRLGTEREREMRRTEYLQELRQDVRYAARQLLRAPTFTAVAVLTLALGVGATTAIFSALHSVVLRPFPWAHPERVVMVAERWGDRDGNVSAPNFLDWREQTTAFRELAALNAVNVTLEGGDAPERVLAMQVSPGFFTVFGVPPALGRTFTAEEDQPGRDQVVVLSHALWKRRFAGDPAVLGRTLRISGREHTVIGVMPEGYDPTTSQEELWVPVAFSPERLAHRDEHYLFVVGLLTGDASVERAQREMDAVMQRLAAQYPKDDGGRGARVASLSEIIVGNLRQRLLVLLGAVGFVLLIACGNVANLLLARGAARAKEIAIRSAIGAGRGRLVRQLLTESAVLALVATAAGLGLAAALIKVLVSAAPPGIPRLEQTRIDWPVLGFALALALASSLVFGLAPALRAARQDLQSVLKEGGRGMGTARDRVRGLLVMTEVALALTLLVGAGLLVRSALYLQRVPPGFDPDGVVTARVSLPPASYQDPQRVARAFKDIVERLGATPGVQSAAVTSQAPLGPGGNSNGLLPEGKALSPENLVDARLRIVTPDYFATLRQPLRRGRVFTERDVRSTTLAAIVSEELARRLFPGEDPIGKRFACCEADPYRERTVVGVVGDVRSQGPTVPVAPEFYLPVDQVPPEAWTWIQRTMTVVVRGRGTPAQLTAAMRAAVHDADPTLPLFGVSTMGDAIRASSAQARFNTTLLGTLGVLGLALAALGIYSVIAYFVSLRAHEIGVRMALGATPADVVRLMTWQGLRPILAGVGAGAAAALATARLLRGSLYGVTASDPVTFAAVVALLVAVGVAATLIPARRATRVDPTRALQQA